MATLNLFCLVMDHCTQKYRDRLVTQEALNHMIGLLSDLESTFESLPVHVVQDSAREEASRDGAATMPR